MSARALLLVSALLVAARCAAPVPDTDETAAPSSGAREAGAPRVDPGEYSADGYHKRPIVEHAGRTLLWAGEEDDGSQAWFDVTGCDIDPTTFQFGIGKDTIPSIDRPVFCEFDDPRLAASGIDLETSVLGIALKGEARAYPVEVMSQREVVNDEFGGEPFAVLW